jgi:enoyl-CoA hydratase/carnithine racemase
MSDTGGSGLATVLAGPSRAKWLLMTGRPIGAERALAWGLVDEVVTPEEVDGSAAELAAELAGHAPGALTMIKSTVDGMWHGQLHAALRAELLGQVALFGGEDYRARKRARVEGS